jgi:molybdopterin-guanine dinucleotide biosynthesis protein MobB
MNGNQRAVCLIGWSGTGKTELAARLIAHYRGAGYHVAAVKKSGEAVEVDRRGSDSDVLRRSGAEETVLLTPRASVVTYTRSLSGDELAALFSSAELIVSEGLPLPGGILLEVTGEKTALEGLKHASRDQLTEPDAYVLTAPLPGELFPAESPRIAAEDFSDLLHFLEERWNAKSQST